MGEKRFYCKLFNWLCCILKPVFQSVSREKIESEPDNPHLRRDIGLETTCEKPQDYQRYL